MELQQLRVRLDLGAIVQAQQRVPFGSVLWRLVGEADLVAERPGSDGLLHALVSAAAACIVHALMLTAHAEPRGLPSSPR